MDQIDIKHLAHLLKVDRSTAPPEPVVYERQWWWAVAGERVREMTGAEVIECIRHKALPTQAILVLAHSYDFARLCMNAINPQRWQYLNPQREVPPPVNQPTVIICPGTHLGRYYQPIMNLLDRREAIIIKLAEADL